MGGLGLRDAGLAGGFRDDDSGVLWLCVDSQARGSPVVGGRAGVMEDGRRSGRGAPST